MNVAFGESDGWVTLLGGTRMGDWTEVGKANWAMKDGALVADKITDTLLLLRTAQPPAQQTSLVQGFSD